MSSELLGAAELASLGPTPSQTQAMHATLPGVNLGGASLPTATSLGPQGQVLVSPF